MFVVAVEQDEVKVACALDDVVGRIGNHDPQAFVFRRESEELARRSEHLGVDFDHYASALRQIAVHELGQRSGTQADEQD